MQHRNRVRISLEALEERWCPAVTARVSFGFLLVGGSATNPGDTIKISQTAADTFKVEDGGTTVGTFSGVTRDVRIGLGSANDKVAVDLGGNTTPRGITALLGGGENSFSLVGGTVRGSLYVNGGTGVDTVALGDGTTSLQVNGNVTAALDGSAGDSLTLADKATIKGSMSTFFVNNTTLAAGSSVEGSVGLVGGTGGNTVTVAGKVAGNLAFTGSPLVDTFTLTGSVGRNLFVSTFAGDDSISLGGTVTGRVFVDSDGGKDKIQFSGSIGSSTTVFAGSGDDNLTIAAGSKFAGNAFIGMGAGNDTVTMAAPADVSIVNMLINGGLGTDTFIGVRVRTGLTLLSFDA
jgi:fibronectin-binding autotransporter adhesin